MGRKHFRGKKVWWWNFTSILTLPSKHALMADLKYLHTLTTHLVARNYKVSLLTLSRDQQVGMIAIICSSFNIGLQPLMYPWKPGYPHFCCQSCATGPLWSLYGTQAPVPVFRCPQIEIGNVSCFKGTRFAVRSHLQEAFKEIAIYMTHINSSTYHQGTQSYAIICDAIAFFGFPYCDIYRTKTWKSWGRYPW